MADVINVSCDALPLAHRVIGFRGNEALSTPYRFVIDLLIGHDVDLDLDAALGERLTLAFDRKDDRPPFQFHGVIATLEMVHELSTAGIYTLTLVPELWQLSLTQHSRVFVDETTPKIIQAILKENGFAPSDYELRLEATYKQLEHVCQYAESDLAFISRWMEREGIYYFFEQGESREKLIITDSVSHHHELLSQPVRYVAMSGADSGFTRGEVIDSLTSRHERQAARVRLKDYDFHRPDLDVAGSADVAKNGIGEVRLFGENFTTPDEGKRLASVRAQQLAARKTVYQASGNALHLRSGYLFSLDEHPRPAFNARYLVTTIEHVANQAAHAMNVQDLLGYERDEVYRCRLTAIPAAVQYRPERLTSTPRIDGIVTATVDGPADSPYAQLDKDGRYLVRIMFDEGEPQDGKASTRVRMLQPHGGSGEGFHFPLRKGTEVLLVFLGGDPDRPLIAGVAPNAHRPSVVTGENHTKNVIQTGGQNRIEMEDADGRQHAHFSTPTANTSIHMGAPIGGHHLISTTDGNSLHHTKGDRDLLALGDNSDEVMGDALERYHKKHSTYVGGMRVIDIRGERHLTIKHEDTVEVHQDASAHYHADVKTLVGGTVVETFEQDYVTHVSGHTKRTSEKKETVVVAERKETIKGNCTQTIVGDNTENVGGKTVRTYSGDLFETVMGKYKQVLLGPKDILDTSHPKKIVVGSKMDMFIGLKSDVTVAGAISLELSRKINISSSMTLDIKGGTTIEVEGIKVKKLQMSLQNALLAIIS